MGRQSAFAACSLLLEFRGRSWVGDYRQRSLPRFSGVSVWCHLARRVVAQESSAVIMNLRNIALPDCAMPWFAQANHC